MEFTVRRKTGVLSVWFLMALNGCQTPMSLFPISDVGEANEQAFAKWTSQLSVGDEVAAFNPRHIIGPDAGTHLCPVCTYLDAAAVVVFAKESANTVSLANRLETLAVNYASHGLRVLLVITDGTESGIKQMARANSLSEISVCLLEPETRSDDLNAWKIDEEQENTVVLYHDYLIRWKKNELRAADFEQLERALKSELRVGRKISP